MKTPELNKPYNYITPSGKNIIVYIKEDCGLVDGLYAPWNKVICKPIGFNNYPDMELDFQCLLAFNP